MLINAFCHPVIIKFNIEYSIYRKMANIFDFYLYSKSIYDVNLTLIRNKLKTKTMLRSCSINCSNFYDLIFLLQNCVANWLYHL